MSGTYREAEGESLTRKEKDRTIRYWKMIEDECRFTWEEARDFGYLVEKHRRSQEGGNVLETLLLKEAVRFALEGAESGIDGTLRCLSASPPSFFVNLWRKVRG